MGLITFQLGFWRLYRCKTWSRLLSTPDLIFSGARDLTGPREIRNPFYFSIPKSSGIELAWPVQPNELRVPLVRMPHVPTIL
jgi:hypothetical protein